MPLPKTLKDEKIVDSWGTVISDGQGKADSIFDKVQQLLEKNDAPGVIWEMGEVTTSFFKGLFGKKRDYLFIKNEALKDHRMYLGARDYGNNLDISWYVTTEPGFFKGLTSKTLAGSDKALSFALDIFAQQDLRAYATVVHHCVLDAVESLMEELGQDTSKIDRKSKGFLEVW